MTVDAVVDVVKQVAGSGTSLSAESLAAVFERSGWNPSGSTTLPFPRRWRHGTLQASILSEGDEDLLEFVFHMIPPDWSVQEYADAIDGEYSAEVQRLHGVSAELLESLTGEFDVEPYPEVKEDAVDFIESACWKIERSYLSVGVAHADEDMPILLLARLRQG
ncbi:hypothetical protein ACF9IK_00330 [Kitasatospora hibisci]|uniref:hypothetical protein n=1 Tax=Kitasatospora hibisci TaxID=3369522 RepID=UPI003754A34D